jgi:hypothetical protein
MDYSIRVYSGSRRNAMPPATASLGEAVAWTLLEPGTGILEQKFADKLEHSFYYAELMSSTEYALGLVRPPLRSRSETVRRAATSVVAHWGDGTGSAR